MRLLDHLVGEQEQIVRDIDAERLGGFECCYHRLEARQPWRTRATRRRQGMFFARPHGETRPPASPTAAHAPRAATPPPRRQAYGHVIAGLRRGLAESDFVEGRNVTVEYRWGDGQLDRMPCSVMNSRLFNRSKCIPAAWPGHQHSRLARTGQGLAPCALFFHVPTAALSNRSKTASHFADGPVKSVADLPIGA
jgi:hypothetical protein